jgi:CRISPR-associated protein Cmr6
VAIQSIPYNGPKLLELLEKQHERRSHDQPSLDLFRSDTFVLNWRAKVGSFPHPDGETMISAGEPCGRWFIEGNQSRPEDRRNIGDNCKFLGELPLNGYIPGSSIRGIVRAWASQYQVLDEQVKQLLGYQSNNKIYSGKIEFLDAFPEKPTKLTLDIVNPQQNFQVFHKGQCEPHSLYTLGDGETDIAIKVAIRGIPGKATPEEVNMLWQWVQQSLDTLGVGSRSASGYGNLKVPEKFMPDISLSLSPQIYSTEVLTFKLFSQGNAGPDLKKSEFRPSHWRGWLRSWLLRFFLAVMSREDAEFTVGEILGTLDESTDKKSRKGNIRIQLASGKPWGDYADYNQSEYYLRFYEWNGDFKITASSHYLNEIILPILKFASMVGGIGRGWRRPLHRFVMDNGMESARGSDLILTYQTPDENGHQQRKIFGLSLDSNTWTHQYNQWKEAVEKYWPDRFQMQGELDAEVFSPESCSVYLVPGSGDTPIDSENLEWKVMDTEDTRGSGVELIYKADYKRKPDVGGNAGKGQPAHCSWVSIKRINGRDSCQEVVCLFMGSNNTLRSQFLSDLSKIDGAVPLFGCQPDRPPPPNEHP